MASIQDYIGNKLNQFKNTVSQTAQNVGNYFNPSTGVVTTPQAPLHPLSTYKPPVQIPQVKSFWTDIPQVDVNKFAESIPNMYRSATQQAINATPFAPGLKFLSNTVATPQVQKSPVGQLVGGIANDLYMTPANIAQGASRGTIGALEGNLPKFLGGVGQAGSAALNVIPMGAMGRAGTVLENIGKLGTKGAVLGGAGAGAIYGGLIGFGKGLENNMDKTIGQQLNEAGIGALQGGLAGAVAGGAFGGITQKFGSWLNKTPNDAKEIIRRWHPDWPEKQLRDEAGRWTNAKTLGLFGKKTQFVGKDAFRLTPEEDAVLSRRLGLPEGSGPMGIKVRGKDEARLEAMLDQPNQTINEGGKIDSKTLNKLQREYDNSVNSLANGSKLNEMMDGTFDKKRIEIINKIFGEDTELAKQHLKDDIVWSNIKEPLSTPLNQGGNYGLKQPQLKGKLNGEDALIQAGLDSGWGGLLKSGQTDITKLTKGERDYLLKSATSYAGAGDPVIIERASNYLKSAPLNQGAIKDFEKNVLNSPVEQLPKTSQELLQEKVMTPVAKEVASTLDMSKSLEKKALQETPQIGNQSFEDIVTSRVNDVKSKVNIIDYLRTPEKVLDKIGLGEQSKQIRTGYETYLKQLPKEIDKITAWSKQVSPESNQRIFQFLDGKPIELDPTELKVANEVKTYLSSWADRLGLPPEKRISNYITHIFPKGMVEKEFDPELAKIIGENVAGSVYDPFTQQRLGKLGYKEDTWAALDAYVKRAVRKVNMDPALESISKAADNLPIESFKYVKNYIDNVNMRPSYVETLIDNFIKSTPIGYSQGQRPFTAITQKARQMVYRGTLGLNPGSALKNLTQGANTYAKLHERYTLQGYMDMLKNFKSNELQDVGVLSNEFVQDRTLSATKKAMEKIDKGLFFMFEQAEKINRGAAYYGAKAKALNEGKTLEQAIEYAKQIVRETQFNFGSIDTPVAMQSDLAKTLMQFQSYNLKQGEFLLGMLKNKEWGGIARYIGASLVLIGTIGQALGMKPQDMIPTIRVGGSPLFTLGGDIVNTVTGQRDQYGNTPSLGGRIKKIGNDLVPFIPAGVELKKLSQGKILSNVPAPSFKIGEMSGPQTVSASETSSKVGPLEKYKLQQQMSDLSKKEKEILSQGSGINLPMLGVVGGMSDEQKLSQLKEIENQKKEIDYSLNKESIQQRTEDQNYTLQSDRLTRNNDFKGWLNTTENYLALLKQRQSVLDPITESDKILSLQNKIEDTELKIKKYKSYGGFTKPKKLKAIKIKAPKAPKLTKLKFKKLKKLSFKLKAPKIPKLKTQQTKA